MTGRFATRPVATGPGRGRSPGTGVEHLPVPRIVATEVAGPEHLAVDRGGRILTGAADGTIWRIGLTGTGEADGVSAVASTGGRPLGLEAAPDGRLLVCDAERGLLSVDPDSGSVRTVVDTVDGRPLLFCSNVTAAADGTAYFTVSSRRYRLADWLGDIMEHSGTGQLLRLRPGGDPEVLMDGLQFANGVVLSPDESFALVAETGARRLRRYWLTGPAAGTHEVFLAGLPGFPDNLCRGAGGLVWIALAGPREPGITLLHHAPVAVRHAAWKAIGSHQPGPRPVARVLGVDASGRVVRDLVHRPSGYRMVTSAREHDGRLIAGSLAENGIAVWDMPASPPTRPLPRPRRPSRREKARPR